MINEILNSEAVRSFLSSHNKKEPIRMTFKPHHHIFYECGCKIVKDGQKEYLFTCEDHETELKNRNK